MLKHRSGSDEDDEWQVAEDWVQSLTAWEHLELKTIQIYSRAFVTRIANKVQLQRISSLKPAVAEGTTGVSTAENYDDVFRFKDVSSDDTSPYDLNEYQAGLRDLGLEQALESYGYSIGSDSPIEARRYPDIPDMVQLGLPFMAQLWRSPTNLQMSAIVHFMVQSIEDSYTKLSHSLPHIPAFEDGAEWEFDSVTELSRYQEQPVGPNFAAMWFRENPLKHLGLGTGFIIWDRERLPEDSLLFIHDFTWKSFTEFDLRDQPSYHGEWPYNEMRFILFRRLGVDGTFLDPDYVERWLEQIDY